MCVYYEYSNYPPSGPTPCSIRIKNAGVIRTIHNAGKMNNAIGRSILIGAL
jgi:hypothetical protein